MMYDSSPRCYAQCGFAQSQQAYDSVVNELFSTLDMVDDHLSSFRFRRKKRRAGGGVPVSNGKVKKNLAFKNPMDFLVDGENIVHQFSVMFARIYFSGLNPFLKTSRYLTMLPMYPKLGNMLILGVAFNCLDPVLTIVTGLSVRHPFLTPMDKKDVSQASHLCMIR
ncbi:hypothetical protein LOK49_LG12G03025 [Camellia lanceoleosa]|uniref:Uncharacterized protein n=1 Tax=Camellia lanceoleosa TaxID=1840588 RepID=A0ACC0FQS4_9ERIC|nr:hypothetical protein LOK49_LG12G03025 [Camellia lanceoleosa]